MVAARRGHGRDPGPRRPALRQPGRRLGAALLLQAAGPVRLPFSFYTPLLVLAAVHMFRASCCSPVPSPAWVRWARFFSAIIPPCSPAQALAWSAAQLPLVLAVWTTPPMVLPILASLAYLYFAVPNVLRGADGYSGRKMAMPTGIVSLSWIPLVAAFFLAGPLAMVSRLIASPFFLLFAFYYLRSEFSNLGQGLRSSGNFHRMMEAAAVNPHDGEAQYQLGLIYQQRRQYTEAIRRFQQAVAIDPTETDAHFQLGRIGYEQGRFNDALAHFQTVLQQDEQARSKRNPPQSWAPPTYRCPGKPPTDRRCSPGTGAVYRPAGVRSGRALSLRAGPGGVGADLARSMPEMYDPGGGSGPDGPAFTAAALRPGGAGWRRNRRVSWLPFD